MKKITISVLIISLMFTLITGCMGNESNAPNEEDTAVFPEATISNADNTGMSLADTNSYRDSVWAFSSSLFSKVLERDAENPVISPLSAYMALSMAASGAQGETLDEFEMSLGLSLEALGDTNQQIIKNFSNTSGNTTLELGNSMWFDSRQVSPKESFTSGLKEHYGAEVFNQDFVSPEIENSVNDWVNRKTHGMIPSIIESINRDTAMILVNTLYMNAQWQSVFDPNNTEEKDFTTRSGNTVKTEFLTSDAQAHSYIKDSNLEGVVLPYDDEHLAFLALKPIDGSSLLDMGLTAESLSDIIGKAKKMDSLVLSMPRFENEFEVRLDDIAKDMGIVTAFDGQIADFSTIEDNANLALSMILHKVNIRVDEKGTEAAASTAIGFDKMSAPLDDIIYLTFDSPYLYAIMDLDSGIPLFLGRMDNPQMASGG